MKPEPTHAEGASTAAAQANQLIFALSVGLAVRSDRGLRDALRGAAGAADDAAFAVGKPGRQPWLRIDGSSVVALRDRPEHLPAVDLAELFVAVGRFGDLLEAAFARTWAAPEAASLVRSLYAPELPDRETILRLRAWAPLLEQSAYGAAAAMFGSLDDLRPRILAALNEDESPRDPGILRYWWQAHSLANLTLLAADRGAQPWLVDMANHFEWTNWTPTFPLFRERSVWLAAVAARSAVAFGELVIGKYLAALSAARTPLKAIDALFGLAAIGLTHSGAAGPTVAELSAQRRALAERRLPEEDIVVMAHDDAISLISGEAAAERRAVLELSGVKWRPDSPRGLATRGALWQDPATFNQRGRFVAFAMLPTVLETPQENFYPRAGGRKSDRQLGMRDAVEVIRRAWLPTAEHARTLH